MHMHFTPISRRTGGAMLALGCMCLLCFAAQGAGAVKVYSLVVNLSRTNGYALGSDIAGQLIVGPSQALSGTIDIDQVNGLYIGPSGNFWTHTRGQSLTGNFTLDSAGRATATIATPQFVTTELIFYVVDQSTALVMERDATPAVGILQVQSF